MREVEMENLSHKQVEEGTNKETLKKQKFPTPANVDASH